MRRLEYKWQVLIVVIFGSFMVILDSTVVNVTIPTFEKVFNSDVNGVEWVLTSYLLSLGIITPLAGYLADNFGIKRMYLISLGLFVLGSALCGFSQSLPMLVMFRVLQGLGGGATVPLGTAQLFAAFPQEERGLANGVFGVPLLVAPALGPTLGGFFIQYFHWSLIFYINLPIGIVGISLGALILKPSETKKSRKLDVIGFLLASSGLGLLLLGLSQASNLGWTDTLVLILIGVALILLISFAFFELRNQDAIVDLHLFRKSIFTLGSIVNWVAVVALFATAFLLPLYLQNIRGQTPFEVGLLLLPQAITAAIAVSFTGRLYDKIGPRTLVFVGLGILAGTSWYFTQITTSSDFVVIEILLALRGLALACCLQPSLNTALSVVERNALPRGTSLVNATRQVIQALATAILSTILATQTAVYSKSLAALPQQQARSQAFVHSLNDAFGFAFWVTLIGVVVSLLLPGWPTKWPIKKPQPQEAEHTAPKKEEQGGGVAA